MNSWQIAMSGSCIPRWIDYWKPSIVSMETYLKLVPHETGIFRRISLRVHRDIEECGARQHTRPEYCYHKTLVMGCKVWASWAQIVNSNSFVFWVSLKRRHLEVGYIVGNQQFRDPLSATLPSRRARSDQWSKVAPKMHIPIDGFDCLGIEI